MFLYVGSFLSNKTTCSLRSFIVASSFWYEGQAKVAPLFRATLSLQCFLNEYMRRLKEAAEFLETMEGETVARDAHNILYRSNDSKLIDWNAYKMGKCVVTGVQHVKQALDIIDKDACRLHPG